MPPATGSRDEFVLIYKSLLRAIIVRNPSGLRLKIAKTLSTHKSFVSQITKSCGSDADPGASRADAVQALSLHACREGALSCGLRERASEARAARGCFPSREAPYEAGQVRSAGSRGRGSTARLRNARSGLHPENGRGALTDRAGCASAKAGDQVWQDCPPSTTRAWPVT